MGALVLVTLQDSLTLEVGYGTGNEGILFFFSYMLGSLDVWSTFHHFYSADPSENLSTWRCAPILEDIQTVPWIVYLTAILVLWTPLLAHMPIPCTVLVSSTSLICPSLFFLCFWTKKFDFPRLFWLTAPWDPLSQSSYGFVFWSGTPPRLPLPSSSGSYITGI